MKRDSQISKKLLKILERKLDPLLQQIVLGIPSFENIWRKSRIILSIVWSTTGSMQINLEYLSTKFKNNFPWNSKMSAARVSQGLVETRSFFKVSDGCLAENFLQISQVSHNSLMSALIPSQKHMSWPAVLYCWYLNEICEAYLRHLSQPFWYNDSTGTFQNQSINHIQLITKWGKFLDTIWTFISTIRPIFQDVFD